MNLNQHIELFFSNLDYKKLLSNTIQSIAIELRTETGLLVPFSGTGNVILTLQLKKFSDYHGFLLCQSGNVIAAFFRTL